MDNFSNIYNNAQSFAINHAMQGFKPLQGIDFNSDKIPTDNGALNYINNQNASKWLKKHYSTDLFTAALNYGFQQDERAWQEKMSNSSYQRAVADMKKAGLNPALMYSHMSGASTPAATTSRADFIANNEARRQVAATQANAQIWSSVINGLSRVISSAASLGKRGTTINRYYINPYGELYQQ